MEASTYSILGGIALILVFLLILHEKRKYQRYKRLMDMDVAIEFQETDSSHDRLRRGSIMLRLQGCADHVKGIVIKDVAFSHSAFHIPAFDKLYFKGSGTSNQLLSVGFRIRRHSLRQLADKRLAVKLSGWIVDNEGNNKPFKAHVPYVFQSASRKDDTLNV